MAVPSRRMNGGEVAGIRAGQGQVGVSTRQARNVTIRSGSAFQLGADPRVQVLEELAGLRDAPRRRDDGLQHRRDEGGPDAVASHVADQEQGLPLSETGRIS